MNQPPDIDTGAPSIALDIEVAGEWRFAGSVSIDEPMGSFRSEEPTGERMYLFGWHEDQVGIWESSLGISTENRAVRQITSAGLDQLSDLSEPFELVVRRAGRPIRLRFTYVPVKTDAR